MLAIRRTDLSPAADASPALRLRRDAKPARASIGPRRNPQSTRAILSAARSILEQQGLAGFSMDAIARLARCGKPTLYRWWPDKAALLADLHEAMLAEHIGPAVPADELPARWLGLWKRTAAGVALRGMIAEAQASDSARALLVSRGLEPYRRAVAAALEGNADDIERALHALLTPLLGALLLDWPASTQAVPLSRPEPVLRDVAPATEYEPAEAEPIRHRGEWID